MTSKKATRTLPEGYGLLRTLDLTKNIKLAIVLNLASLALFFGFGILFYWLLSLVRPGLFASGAVFALNLFSMGSFLVELLVLAVIYVVMILLHEAIHGVFFWLFTGERPKFGFNGLYAYAGAPDWYLARGAYLWVSMAPLVLLSTVGFAVLTLVPVDWAFPLYLFITLNAAGAVGDIYAFFWILAKPNSILVQDFGDRMRVFTPSASQDEASQKAE